MIREGEVGMYSVTAAPRATQQEDSASRNWTSRYPNSHHLYSLQNGPIENVEKLGSITFGKKKIILHSAWTRPGIYGDYFFASFYKVVFRKVLSIVLCKEDD